MRAPLSYVPAMPAAIGIMAGIIIFDQGFFLSGICVLLTAFLVFCFFHNQYFSYFCLFAACGILVSASYQPSYPPEIIFIGSHSVEGKILRTVEKTQTTTYVLEIKKIGEEAVTPFKANLSINSVENIIGDGTVITCKVIFRKIENTEDLPHEIDYKQYLKTEGIVCTGSIISGIGILKKPGKYHHLIQTFRKNLYNAIVSSPCSPGASSFLTATILGDKSLLTEYDINNFRSSGVAHMLALSGLHVGIIATIFTVLLFPLGIRYRHRGIRSAIVMIVIWLYAILVGMQPSILRASIMLTVCILSSYLQRGYFLLNSLFISIIIILLVNPFWLYTPGFQLSVMAVASIFMFGNIVPRKLKRYPIVFYSLNLILIPIAAMMGTGIISAYYFGTLPQMFLFGNIIVGLILPWLLAGGIILTFFTSMNIKCVLIGKIVDELYKLMTDSLIFLSSKGGEYSDIFFSAWTILPYIIAIIFLAFAIRQRKAYQWTMCTAMMCICIIVYTCDTENLPTAELYIPRTSNNTRIIMRSGNECRLYTNSDSPEMDLADCSTKYRRFLLSRGCSNNFELSSDVWHNDYFLIDKEFVCICGTFIRIIGADPRSTSFDRHFPYSLITNKYTGSISELFQQINSDTILLGPDLHPSRRARMIRECSDSIPFRDIRRQGFSIIK